MWGTYHPLEWEDFCIAMLGKGKLLDLKADARELYRPDYPMLVESLRQRAHQLGIAA